MTTIAEKLQAIINAKEDIKTAIQNKGVTPTGGLTTYATAIDSITTGGGNDGDVSNGLDFTVIGYNEDANRAALESIQYSVEYKSTNKLLEIQEAINDKLMGATSAPGYIRDAAYDVVICPYFYTYNVTDMTELFSMCSSLTTIPRFGTSNVTNMYGMFYMCESLGTIPMLDTSNVTNMSYMFYKCYALKTIPMLDTSKVTNMGGMFFGCSSLQSIPLLDTSNVTYIGALFGDVKNMSLTDIGGFKNLGMQSSLNTTQSWLFEMVPNLTKQSVMNIINNLYDRKSAGYSVLKISFARNHIAMLSDDEIAIATNKGWTLTTS